MSTSFAPTAQTRTSALHALMVAGVIHASLSASASENAITIMAHVCLVQKDILLHDNVLRAQITVKRVIQVIVTNATKDLHL